MKKHQPLLSRIGLCLVVGVVALSCSSARTSASPTSRSSITGQEWKLYILNDGWQRLGLGYELDGSWATLSSVDLSAAAFVVSAQDVDSYNWSTQSIALNADASQKLLVAFPGPYVESMLTYHAFVVTLDGKRLYGGIFLEPFSQMGIEYPVIYVAETNGEVVFSVRPKQIGYNDYGSLAPTLKSRIELSDVRDYFAQLGKLGN